MGSWIIGWIRWLKARIRWIGGLAIALASSGAAWASSTPVGGTWESWTVTWGGEAHEVRVYRPTGFPAHRPYPVVYLLAGWAMGLGMWARPDLEQAADAAQVMLVALQGEDEGVPSYYSIYTGLPWPGGAAWRVSFYDWFFQGVLPWVESRYPVRRDPGGRALVGFSMGGKGAFSLAAHRPDRFAAAVSIGGVMDLTLHDSPALRSVYGPPGADPLRVAADNPIDLAANLKGMSLMLFHGAADPEVHPVQSRRIHDALEALGYPHRWEEIPGMGHEVSPAVVARIFEELSRILRAPYRPPDRWTYRFAMARTRTVYGMTMVRTDLAGWTELHEVTPEGFRVRTEVPLTLITPPWYPPGARLSVRIWEAAEGALFAARSIPAPGGRLRLTLPAGDWRIAIEGGAREPGGIRSTDEIPALPRAPDPIRPLRRKPLCPTEDPACYRF